MHDDASEECLFLNFIDFPIHFINNAEDATFFTAYIEVFHVRRSLIAESFLFVNVKFIGCCVH
jgi:hypothetical protein